MYSEIQRAFNFFQGLARHAVGIDHRGPHIRMPEQRLDRADIVVRLEQMGKSGVPSYDYQISKLTY